MRALTYDRYTDVDGLTVADIATPTPGDDQVLIRVEAAGLNPYDWHMYQGSPRFMRMQTGLTVKETRTVGADMAGVVEAVGSAVTSVAPGARVLAEGDGSVAEFASVGADALAPLPDHVTFAQAAATPMAGLTALQALRDAGEIEPGAKVLVWGASGGVGHMAVQIAGLLGADAVDAVCSARNVAMVEGLGARRVYDYTADEMPEGPYDVIVDTVSTASVSTLKGLLAEGGSIVTVGSASGGKLLGPLLPMVGRMIGAKLRGVRLVSMLAKTETADLEQLATWLGDGEIAPVIAKEYGLDDAVEACRELEAGHVAGKLVVTLAD